MVFPETAARPARTVMLALGLAAGALLAAGCGGGDGEATAAGEGGGDTKTATTRPGEEPGAAVDVRDLKFQPGEVTVSPGAVVVWRFDDGAIPHDVKADGFQSPTLDRAEWTYRFDRPGRYGYLCSLHPFMKGTVVVR